jgi:serine/threonine protein kinase/tetratricopeptide (TPR) repeat protein
MGVTYKAFDVDLRYPVALKVINEQYLVYQGARLRFLREARAAASVRHPNVASVFYLGKTGGDYFYAMEFVDGETLERLIKRSGRLETKVALEIAAQITNGLAAIHKQRLIHRDIKPSNIMVSFAEGNVLTAKIIDLGLAKAISEPGSQTSISTPGGFAGTPAFASPEQFAGVGVDIRSDLYSLGATLWQAVTGDNVFVGSTADLMYQHQHAPLPLEKLGDVPQPVAILLEMLLEKDPSRRFQDPLELQNAMPAIMDAMDEGCTIDRLKLQNFRPADSRAIAGTVGRGAKRQVRNSRGWLGWTGAMLLVATAVLGIWSSFFHLSFLGHRSLDADPSEKSIAVLPFETLSDSKTDNYFADGIQDEILNNLAKISQLKVISRTSVMQYRGDTKRDLRKVANTLGVANVLEGTVRREANRVRVSTELIDARNDNTIWADSYDHDLTDIFAIQSQVAQTIAAKLAAMLSPQEKQWIEAKPTSNLEAYDLYLRGNQLVLNAGAASTIVSVEKPLEEALGFLEQALRLDPKFTLAYCVSAKAYDLLYQFSEPTLEWRARADIAIDNALSLAPDLPEVHLACAYHLYYVYRDYEGAKEQLAIARRGRANDVEATLLTAYMDRRQGNWEKAVQEFNEAIARDPANAEAIAELSSTLLLMRQFRAAEQTYDRLIELAPGQPLLKVLKAYLVAMRTGNDGPVRLAFAELPASMADDRDMLCYRLKLALDTRDWAQAKQLIDKMNDGEDNGNFAYGTQAVPVGCYSILLARLRGERPGENSSFGETRERLSQKVQKSEGNAGLLSQLAVVDALLGHKEVAISEAKRAVTMLPPSKDAVDGSYVAINLAVVYAWTNEPDSAFRTLDPLIKTPHGLYYYDLKLSSYFDPLRKHPLFEKLLAQLAPRE